MSRIHDLEKLLNYRDLRKKIISIKNELSDNEKMLSYLENSAVEETEGTINDLEHQLKKVEEDFLKNLEYLKMQPFEDSEIFRSFVFPQLSPNDKMFISGKRNTNVVARVIFNIVRFIIILIISNAIAPFLWVIGDFIINWNTNNSSIDDISTLGGIILLVSPSIVAIILSLVCYIHDGRRVKKINISYSAQMNQAHQQLNELKNRFENERPNRINRCNSDYKDKKVKLEKELDSKKKDLKNIPSMIDEYKEKVAENRQDYDKIKPLYDDSVKRVKIPELDNPKALDYCIKLLSEERAESAGAAYNMFEEAERHRERVKINEESNRLKRQQIQTSIAVAEKTSQAYRDAADKASQAYRDAADKASQAYRDAADKTSQAHRDAADKIIEEQKKMHDERMSYLRDGY